jgi:4-coumarate--CoA ligase
MTEFSVFAWNTDEEYVDGSCGFVAPNVEIKIIDVNTGENLSANIDGELCVRGPTLFSGYLKNENATKEAIDSKGWFHSGDVGHYDDTGRLFITDRVKELIKYGMSSVAPVEVEQFLLKNIAVQDVVVVGVQQQIGVQLPRAYVKIRSGYTLTSDELKKYVKGIV